MAKLEGEAFDYYVSLGINRSQKAVAKHYGVSLRTVARRAVKENWSTRAAVIDAKAQIIGDEKRAETIGEMNSRHITVLRAIQSRALRAVQDYPLKSGLHGMRMAELTIRLERLIRADPNAEDMVEHAEEVARHVREYLGDLDESVPK
jgi:uncharacterized DUF497 family protein